MRRRMYCTALLALSVALPLVAGTLSGSMSLWIDYNPWYERVDALDVGFEVDYSLGEVVLSTDGLFVLPGTWVWQGFSAVGRVGGYALTTNVLFGPSTTDYLYAEAIVELSIAGIETVWHAAQLSDAVFGGPSDGWAVRIAGSVGAMDVVAISEFGARIEDDDFGGITIVHIETGEERHYVTDPAVPGQGFTGEKLSVRGLSFGCVDLDAALYFTCDGFDYVSFGIVGIDVGGLSWVAFDADLTFEIDEKTLTLEPGLSLGEVACIEVYAELAWDSSSLSIDGIGLYGIELVCRLGPVTVRDVAVLNPDTVLPRYVITTEAYGSVIERRVDADEAGHEYYYYWELLSIAYAGAGCCGGDLTFLANVYFWEHSSNLFGWSMTHIEAAIPLAETLSFTLGMEAYRSGIGSLAFGFRVDW